jgi:hypothetical protein
MLWSAKALCNVRENTQYVTFDIDFTYWALLWMLYQHFSFFSLAFIILNEMTKITNSISHTFLVTLALVCCILYIFMVFIVCLVLYMYDVWYACLEMIKAKCLILTIIYVKEIRSPMKFWFFFIDWYCWSWHYICSNP